jgi:hypothetical protein
MNTHPTSAATRCFTAKLSELDQSSGGLDVPLRPAVALTVIVLSSLGLWAAIWSAVTALTAVRL